MAITATRLDSMNIGLRLTGGSTTAVLFTLNLNTGNVVSSYLSALDRSIIKSTALRLFQLVPFAERGTVEFMERLLAVAPADGVAVTLSAVSSFGSADFILQVGATPANVILAVPATIGNGISTSSAGGGGGPVSVSLQDAYDGGNSIALANGVDLNVTPTASGDPGAGVYIETRGGDIYLTAHNTAVIMYSDDEGNGSVGQMDVSSDFANMFSVNSDGNKAGRVYCSQGDVNIEADDRIVVDAENRISIGLNFSDGINIGGSGAPVMFGSGDTYTGYDPAPVGYVFGNANGSGIVKGHIVYPTSVYVGLSDAAGVGAAREVLGVCLEAGSFFVNDSRIATMHGGVVEVLPEAAWVPSGTDVGLPVYLSAVTPGTITSVKPSTPGQRVYKVGLLLSATPLLDGTYPVLWQPQFIQDL